MPSNTRNSKKSKLVYRLGEKVFNDQFQERFENKKKVAHVWIGSVRDDPWQTADLYGLRGIVYRGDLYWKFGGEWCLLGETIIEGVVKKIETAQ